MTVEAFHALLRLLSLKAPYSVKQGNSNKRERQFD
jgi:hypothetical protein